MKILPWLGTSLSQLGAIQNYVGLSNSTGSCISTADGKKEFLTEKYIGKNFHSDDAKRKSLWIPITIGATILVFLAIYFLTPLFEVSLTFWEAVGFTLVGLNCAKLVLTIIRGLTLPRKLREYHGGEHKAICLLYAALEPNKENFALMPKTIYQCGFAEETRKMTLGVLIGTGLILHFHILLWPALGILLSDLILSFALIIIYILSDLLFQKSPDKIQYCVLSASALIRAIISFILVLPVLIEYFLAVREPRASIAEEELKLAKQIQEHHQELELTQASACTYSKIA